MRSPQSLKSIFATSLLFVAFLVAISAFVYQFYLTRPPKPRIWSVEELALYNGTDEELPVLLSVIGSVFDVTKGKSHYGPGGGYHHFSGRDASRAFISGNFTGDGLTDSLQGLTSEQVNSVVNWRKFYIERYIYVGTLVGRYYDKEGNPSKYLKGIEAKAKRGAQLLEKQKVEEAKIPGCNSKWSQNEGGLVWCDSGYPRLMRRPGDIALTGQTSQRCVCMKKEELEKPGLELYKGCEHLSQSCAV